jgi:hypothetical protein
LGRSELRPSQWDLLVHRWLRRIGLNVADLNEYRDAFTVYDMRDGHECAQIRPGKMAFEPLISPDGRTLAIPTERRDRVELWDIPPRKSLTWRAAGAALLALPIALVAWRRVRKLRAA